MNKKNLKLGVILIILIALAYAYQGPYLNWKANYDKKKDNIFAGLNAVDIDKITITRGKQTTTLEKEGDKWKVGGSKGFYVQKDSADEVIKALNDAKNSEIDLISTNRDKKKDFMVDQGSGIEINLLKGDKQILNFDIGKLGSDYSSTYISQNNNDKTYAIKMMLPPIFDKEDWRDKTIFQSDKNKIAKIRIHTSKKEYTVEKKGNKWEETSPAKSSPDQGKIGKILDIMSSLTASDIPEQNFKGTDLEKNRLVIDATGDGINNVLMVGKDNGKNLFYVKKGDSDNIYLFTKSQKDSIDQAVATLK